MFPPFPSTDQQRCWAEVGRNDWEYSVPCGKPSISELGLCGAHYEEITGQTWEGEQSHADGASQETTQNARG